MSQTPHALHQETPNGNVCAQETGLRKRGQNTDRQNGKVASHEYAMNHDKSDDLKRSPKQIQTTTSMTVTTAVATTSSAATTIFPATNAMAVSSTRNRSLSESSADELFRSGAVIRQGGFNKKMWRNELEINPSSTRAQPQRKGSRSNSVDNVSNTTGVGADCCCFGGSRRKNRISDAIDVGIRVALVFIFISLEATNSFKRKIQMEKLWLYKNPRTPDIVSPSALLLSVIFGPLFVTMLLLWLTGNRRDFRAASWVWTLALGFNGLTTSLLKITVGRHRPDFFYRCFPDGVMVLNNATDTTKQTDIFNCTGNVYDIQEGRKSFPSGHSSFAFVGFGFIAIYVGAKLHAFSARGRGQSWRLCIAITPLIVAALIAVSRTCDYHHHWEDVVVGGLIGIFITYLVYRQYYPSIFSRNCDRAYHRSCRDHVDKQHNRIIQRSTYRDLSCEDDREKSSLDSANETFENDVLKENFESASKDECRPLILDG